VPPGEGAAARLDTEQRRPEVAVAKRSTMRKARIALARRLAIIMHAMLRQGSEFKPA